jgi:hypothetical protein
MNHPASRLIQRFGRTARLAVWFASLILVFQLLGATQHRHDIVHAASDCAACALAAQPPSPPSPPVIPELAASAPTLHYVLAQSMSPVPPRPVSFLTPHAQAPPPAFM